MIAINLLGKPGVVVNGHASKLPTAKMSALLAYLVVEQPRVHLRDNLIDLLWPGFVLPRARQNLSQALSQLRKALGPGAVMLVADHTSVTLRPDLLPDGQPLAVDFAEFNRLCAAVASHTHVDPYRCAECQAQLARAADLAHGELLTGVQVDECPDFEQWLLVERERLHTALLRVLHDLAEGAMARAAYADAIAFAERQIGLEAWREEASRQLMRALALADRRSDALAEYARLAQTLADELSVTPGKATRQLLADVQAGKVQSVQPSSPVKGNLPALLTPLVGRAEEIEAISQTLLAQQTRLVTLCGQGGIGKTRLALEIGRRLLTDRPQAFGDGIWFVPLMGVSAPENVPLAVAQALNLSLAGSADVRSAVVNLLRPRQLLLILDNFEHLTDGRGWLVDLLRGAPGVSLLLTSRERLSLHSEDVYDLRGLSIPPEGAPFAAAGDYESVTLFLDSARRLYKWWRLDQANWPQLVAVCQLLEGLPLGIRLTVLLLETYDLAAIATRIRAEWPTEEEMLASDLPDVAPHHRSMVAVLNQSWQHLTAEEQIALARLSVLYGDFEPVAAQQIADVPPIVLKRLQSKSLLRRIDGGRLNIHQLVRQYAARRLAAWPEHAGAARAQHAAYYLSRLAEYAGAQGERQAVLLAGLRDSLFNLREAWQYAVQTEHPALTVPVVNSLARFAFISSRHAYGRELLHALRRHFEAQPLAALSPPQRALYAWAAVREAGTWGDVQSYDEAQAILDAAQAVVQTVNDPALQAAVDYRRGLKALHYDLDNQRALACFERGIAHVRTAGDRVLEIAFLRHISSVYRQRGDYGGMLKYLEQALAVCHATADLDNAIVVETWMTDCRLKRGEYWAARETAQHVLALTGTARPTYHTWSAQLSLGTAEALMGQTAAGSERLVQVVQPMRATGDRWGAATALLALASAQLDSGRLAEADANICAGEQMSSEAKLTEMVEMFHLARGYLALAHADYAAAERELPSVEQAMRKLGRTITVVEAQVVRAYCLLASGRSDAVAAAADFVCDSLRYVRAQRLDGALRREQLYWLAWQVAVTIGCGDADALLARGRTFVRSVADAIADPAFRQSYLTRMVARDFG